MTDLCPGGGTSQVKSGLSEFVVITSGALALALQRYGAARLQFLIPLLGLPPLELGPFCGTDPPDQPTFTEDEIFALLQLKLDADYFSGLAKARDLVLRMLWYDMCECTTPSADPYVEPTLPTNTPLPVGPAAPIIPPCLEPVTESHDIVPGGSVVINLPTVIGQNASLVTVQSSNTGGDSISSATRTVAWISATGVSTVLASWNAVANAAIPLKEVFLPPGVEHVRIALEEAGHTGISHHFEDVITVWCDGATPGGTSQLPCCPPDESTQSYLDLILNMVTLIQRQAVPFSYVYGTNHEDLSGDGEIAVQGILGVSINITTLPGYVGSADGTPVHLFDAGFITLGTADGWALSRRLDADGSLILAPPGAGAITRVGYTLPAGLVCDIRELVREP
jgi:hypothetical protein